MASVLGGSHAKDPAFRWMRPAILSRLQEEVDAACDELVRMNVKKPSKDLITRMSGRIYDRMSLAYPEVERYAKSLDAKSLEAFGVDAQEWGGGFAGLIALLLLANFFGRRRNFRRGGRFY